MSTKVAAPAVTPVSETEPPRPAVRRSRTGQKGALFTLPFTIGFLAVYVVPVGYAFFQSLYKVQRSGLGYGPARTEWAGMSNFTKGLQDGAFWEAMTRVAIFGAVQIPVMLGLALLMALLLDGITARAVPLFRVGFLLPYVIPGVVGTIIWLYLYSPTITPLKSLGFDFTFSSPAAGYLTIGNLLLWQGLGLNMILIYSALQAIPGELYEAARIDGASERRIAWSIKVPNIRAVLVLTGMFSLIGRLQLFVEPLFFRQIGPQAISKDWSPMLMIYTESFQKNDYHYAAALSIILALVTGVLAFVFYRMTNRKMT